jgi:hypothetical protein
VRLKVSAEKTFTKMALTSENGWYLTPEGVALCEGQVKKALDIDLREIGAGFLSEEINRGKLETIDAGNDIRIFNDYNVWLGL